MWSLEKQKELIRSLPINATEVNIVEAYDEELAAVTNYSQLYEFTERWHALYELRLLPVTKVTVMPQHSLPLTDMLVAIEKYRTTRDRSYLKEYSAQVVFPVAFEELACLMDVRECKRPQEFFGWFLSRREESVVKIEKFQNDYHAYMESMRSKICEQELVQGKLAREMFIVPFCNKHNISFKNGQFTKAINGFGDEAKALLRLINWRFNRDIPFGKAIEDYKPGAP